MPIYVYQAVEKGCDYCKERFEVKQSFSDKPLEKCPKCGAKVKKLITIPSLPSDYVAHSPLLRKYGK